MNFSDSDEMGRHFRNKGFLPTKNMNEANAILINTCTVRALAEHKAMSFVGSLRKWKMGNPESLVIVTGCAAERAKDEFKSKFPFVDLVVGAKDIDQFPQKLDQVLTHTPKHLSSQDMSLVPDELTSSLKGSVSQFVTIMRGCNYSCTYCIVPSVRGREYYRPVADILKDVKARADEEAKEIWLLGQTVNSYSPEDSPHPKYDFSDLLKDISKIAGIQRIRFISPHPYYLNQKLIQTMADEEKICKHIHLPVQSGSNSILQRMKRNYTRESYLQKVKDLRAAMPNISITTDIIVGFPGESDQDFVQTKTLVEEAGFDSAYCFIYSPRPGTSAAEWEDNVPSATKETRVNEILKLTDNQGVQRAASLKGSVQNVLVEEDQGDGFYRGKTRGSWRVRINDKRLKLGQLADIQITGTHSRELQGKLVK